MSDISKEELKKEIAAVLKDADLTSTSSKKVRQDIEAKLDIDLSPRRKEIDELVMEYIDQDKGKASKKNGNVEDEEEDDEEENDEDEEEEEDDEEEKKPKRSNSKKGPPAKRSKAASSDESEDGSEDEGDDEYSPSKKSKKTANKRASAGRKKKGGSDDDSDEDWGKGKKKRGGGAAATKKAPGAKRGGGGGYTKPVKLSAELAALVGEDSMPRHEVVKRVWGIIKERNLYDPKNKQFAICDDELLKVFGVKRFRTFGMMKFLKNHFKD